MLLACLKVDNKWIQHLFSRSQDTESMFSTSDNFSALMGMCGIGRGEMTEKKH